MDGVDDKDKAREPAALRAQETQPVKLIKRYTNRKLYDTVESRYVTLDEIAEMIRAGDDVRIIDNRSKEDLTSVTLAQIIFEQEKKLSRMPLGVLRGIVRHGGGSFQGFVEREIQPRVASIREEAEHRIEKMFRRERGGRLCEQTDSPQQENCAELDSREVAPDTDDPARRQEKDSAALVRMLVEARESIEAWQRTMDQRLQATVRDAAKLPVKAINVPGLRKNLTALRNRLDDLDKRLAELEDKS